MQSYKVWRVSVCHLSFFALHFCCDATFLRGYERFVLSPGLFSPYLCTCRARDAPNAKGVDERFHFQTWSATTKEQMKRQSTPYLYIKWCRPELPILFPRSQFGLIRVSHDNDFPRCLCTDSRFHIAKLAIKNNFRVKICENRALECQCCDQRAVGSWMKNTRSPRQEYLIDGFEATIFTNY